MLQELTTNLLLTTDTYTVPGPPYQLLLSAVKVMCTSPCCHCPPPLGWAEYTPAAGTPLPKNSISASASEL